MIVCFLDGRIGKLPAVSVCVHISIVSLYACFFGRFVVCCKSRTPLQEFNLVIFSSFNWRQSWLALDHVDKKTLQPSTTPKTEICKEKAARDSC